jgi:AcrR family transcriptional regulator
MANRHDSSFPPDDDYAPAEMPREPRVRERILDAAVSVLENSGLRKFAQPHIAKVAGVAQGHLTYYFPKRQDLVSALLTKFIELVKDDLPQALIDGAHDRVDTMRARALRVAAHILKNRQRARMLLGLIVESENDPQLREDLAENLKFVRSMLAKFLGRSPKDPDVEIAMAMFLGVGLQHLVLDGERTNEQTDEILRRVEDWLAAMPAREEEPAEKPEPARKESSRPKKV